MTHYTATFIILETDMKHDLLIMSSKTLDKETITEVMEQRILKRFGGKLPSLNSYSDFKIIEIKED